MSKLSFGLGVTLYSFNYEYYTYKYTLEQIMELIGSLGPAQGIELVGPQMIRNYPNVSDEFEKSFKNALEKYDLRPTAYGAYHDAQRIAGRYMTHDEQKEYLKAQIRSAAKLGFPVIRMVGCKTLVAELVPYAEKYNVKMGIEIHAPMMIETIGEMLELIKKTDSPYFGIIPDCGPFCSKPADLYVNRFLEQGVHPDIAAKILEMWEARVSEDAIRAEVKKMGGDDLALMMATESQTYFGHSDPKSLLAVMPHIVHVHGKFFNVDEKGNESAVRFPEIVSALQEGGYSNYMSCEYEGHHWVPEQDAFTQIKRIQALIMRQVENS